LIKLPLVSILVPVYNVENFVHAAVSSLLNQTYSNIEIIIVDDASTDDTYNICKNLAAGDSRIRLFRNQINLKIALTLNYAFSASRGEYIARMDGDDISLFDRIQRQIEYLTSNPEINLVGVSLIGIDASGNEISKFEHSSNFNFLNKSIRYVTPVSHVWVAERQVYEKLNGYRNMSGCEDYDFLLRMLSFGFKFSNVPEYFGYLVRLQREGNTQASIGLRQRKLFSYVYELYKERLKYGVDSFSIKKMEDRLMISNFSNRLYFVSNLFLNRAIIERAKGNPIMTIVYILASAISPNQVFYLWQRAIYRILIIFNKYHN
jgi:glycosyltransferase involved in cell wall biosynthesis